MRSPVVRVAPPSSIAATETPGRVYGFTPSLLLVSDNFGRCWRPIPLEGIPFSDQACMPQ